MIPTLEIQGTPGRELEVHTTQRFLFGTKMVMQDGRMFRYASFGQGGTPGLVWQGPANIANHILQTPASAGAVNDRTLRVQLGATAVAADEYKDGYLTINLGTGFGFNYVIDTHPAVLSGGIMTVPLGAGYGLQAAVPTTANSVSLVHNPYRAVFQGTHTQIPAGVGLQTVSTGNFGWLQTRGPATVLTSGALVVGNPVVATGALTGAVAAFAGAGAATEYEFGIVMLNAGNTNMSVIYVSLE